MKKKIAIILPYKEIYSEKYAGSASICVKDYCNFCKDSVSEVQKQDISISPYLSPEPVRGKTNEPSNLVHTLKFISNIRNQSENELAENTTKNFFRLFNLNNSL